MYFYLLNASLKMAEKGRNMWEDYHKLFIIVSNHSAIVGIYIRWLILYLSFL